MEVAEKIKKYMDDNGVSQAFLSRKTGINTVKLNLALNGKRRLTFPEYELICGALNVEADMFLEARLPARGEIIHDHDQV